MRITKLVTFAMSIGSVASLTVLGGGSAAAGTPFDWPTACTGGTLTIYRYPASGSAGAGTSVYGDLGTCDGIRYPSVDLKYPVIPTDPGPQPISSGTISLHDPLSSDTAADPYQNSNDVSGVWVESPVGVPTSTTLTVGRPGTTQFGLTIESTVITDPGSAWGGLGKIRVDRAVIF
ncbi:hypothetical protein GPX89_34680 [Nocardia sp. ET3-3]|uniref:Secreted protein n=1 Tax=Nocardia terrae TaxID=2675851 RepID=A0A7K1V6V1_9NOCA|nr:hypothetical protein [Nocardia terrae]MVU82364.1 hypothetical protein [Nocardia terrae]